MVIADEEPKLVDADFQHVHALIIERTELAQLLAGHLSVVKNQMLKEFNPVDIATTNLSKLEAMSYKKDTVINDRSKAALSLLAQDSDKRTNVVKVNHPICISICRN